ncbi:MAG: branched-chain amino acid ABC transporter permease [Nitrospinota bacterium]
MLAGIALVVYPFIFTLPFPQHIMIMIFLYAMLGSAWNILGGYAGQISIGHAVYFGIGAYTSSFLFKHFGISPWLAVGPAVFFAIAVSVIIGYPTFMLRGHYFVLASIFIAEIVHILFNNWELVGAAIGIEMPIVKSDSLWGSLWSFQFHGSKLPYYYIIMAMFLLVTYVSYRVRGSRFGYYFRAIRDDQDAAKSLGVDITKYKLLAMIISAAFTAFGGVFYAQYVLFVEPPSVISLVVSFQICFVAIFGGIGTLWGPVIGAFAVVPLSEYLRVYLSGQIATDISGLAGGSPLAYLRYYLSGGGGNLDLLVYGFLIMMIARYQPRGILGFFQKMD